MKKILPFLLVFLSLPALAQTMPDTAAVSREMPSQYAELKGWCRQAIHDPKRGQIVIYYRHDAHGRCVSHFKVAAK